MARVHYFVALFALMVCAACSGTPTPEFIVPTVAELPTLADTPLPETATIVPPLTHTLPPAVTFASSNTPTPADTAPPALAPSGTFTQTETATVTPSLTITPTPTYTPTLTPTETITPGPVNALLDLAMHATVLPVTPPAQSQSVVPLPILTAAAGTVLPGSTVVVGTPASPSGCAFPPTGSFANVYFGDSTLVAQLGCPTTSDTQLATAVQTYEHGLMIYVAEQPGIIYALFSDGTFKRYADTWVEGTDPNNGGETPPTGLIEPARGFGKVWRDNPEVREGLGWAVTEEAGSDSRELLFERGRLIYMPQRYQTIAIIESPSSTNGMWRVFTGGA
jgi:hypothetical protein